MLQNKLPSIEFKNERVIGITFSLINFLSSLRMIWVLFAIDHDQRSFRFLGIILGIQILFLAFGLLKKANKFFFGLLHISGAPFVLYFVFIYSKRILRPILVKQTAMVQAEVSTWFHAVFLFCALTIIVNFIRDLTGRATATISKPVSRDSRSRLLNIGYYTVVIILIIYWIYTQFINPLPIYSNYDPEFSYMMNSLTPFKDFESYIRMDHPGTFLQLSGSLIAIILSPLSLIHGGFPYQYHIIHPDAFLYSARFIILLLNIATLRLIYKIFQYPTTWTESLAGLSAMIVYFATHKFSFAFLTNWSPNAFSFAAGTYILIVLYILTTRGKLIDFRTLWMVSLAAGLIATIHIYMLTLILCVIVVVFLSYLFEHNRWKEPFKFSAFSAFGAAAGYLTGTLIILRQYESLLRWLINVATHQGSYGGGSAGFASLTSLAKNFRMLWRFNTALFIFWILSIVVMAGLFILQKKKNEINKPTWAFILGVNLQIGILLILFAKHPGNRYLLSIAASFPLLLIAAAGLFKDRSKSASIGFSAILTGLVILFVFTLNLSLANHHELINYFIQYDEEIESFKETQQTSAGFESNAIFYYWTYNTWSPCYSLWLGNEFSKSIFTDEVTEICPRDLQYDIWSKPIDTPINLRDTNNLNILIVNDRNFEIVDDLNYITKIESRIENLGFILVQ